jgi:hypothetical protein
MNKKDVLNAFDIMRLLQVDMDKFFIVKYSDYAVLRFLSKSGRIAQFGEVDLESLKDFDLYPVQWVPGHSQYTFTPVFHGLMFN